MAKFTVRIELSEADFDDYETLHEEMEKKGFSRTITDSSGVNYQLPDAEYNYTGAKSTQEVLDLAKLAAKLTNVDFRILVTKSEKRKWYNLNKV